jgi:hypothetical protein
MAAALIEYLTFCLIMGRTIAQAVSRRLPTVAARVRSQGQWFSEFFGLPRQFSFHQVLRIHQLPYDPCYMVPKLTAPLNNIRTNKQTTKQTNKH